MDKNKYLVMIDGKDKTEEIEDVFSLTQPKTRIKFYNKETIYSYGKNKVSILGNPKEIDTSQYLLYLDDNCLSNIVKALDFQNYIRVSYQNGRETVYEKKRIKIENNILVNNSSGKKILEYLKELAQNVDVENDFLFNQYKKMTEVSENSVLAKYLNPSEIDTLKNDTVTIFPFGFNLSQEMAMTKALTNQISIIEGPPGTGKTQTILNILANIIMQDKTVAIVSNNNSATMNV